MIRKLVHKGSCVAEVDVEILDTKEGWPPYLFLEDAKKLDEERGALREGDLTRTTTLVRVFSLKLVSV